MQYVYVVTLFAMTALHGNAALAFVADDGASDASSDVGSISDFPKIDQFEDVGLVRKSDLDSHCEQIFTSIDQAMEEIGASPELQAMTDCETAAGVDAFDGKLWDAGCFNMDSWQEPQCVALRCEQKAAYDHCKPEQEAFFAMPQWAANEARVRDAIKFACYTDERIYSQNPPPADNCDFMDD